jgi:hypothetical protein
MDFSNLRVNPNRLPKIFARNSQSVNQKEIQRIESLLLKEEVKGELTPLEYERLEELQEKQKFSSPHTVGIGAQAYLLFIYSLKKYGKAAKLISDSLMEPSAANGTLKENYVINLIEAHRGIKLYRNKVRLKNDYLVGVPDAFDDEDWEKSRFVHEIKTTSNRLKFLNRKRYPITIHRFLQVQGYMALTGKKKAAVHHCLVDYPEPVILYQKDKMFNYFCPDGIETDRFREEWAIMERKLRFLEMPSSDRIFTCYVERDNRIIDKIYERVQVCRDWLNDFVEFDKEVESTGICTIQQNTYSALLRKLGFE